MWSTVSVWNDTRRLGAIFRIAAGAVIACGCGKITSGVLPGHKRHHDKCEFCNAGTKLQLFVKSPVVFRTTMGPSATCAIAIKTAWNHKHYKQTIFPANSIDYYYHSTNLTIENSLTMHHWYQLNIAITSGTPFLELAVHNHLTKFLHSGDANLQARIQFCGIKENKHYEGGIFSAQMLWWEIVMKLSFNTPLSSDVTSFFWCTALSFIRAAWGRSRKWFPSHLLCTQCTNNGSYSDFSASYHHEGFWIGMVTMSRRYSWSYAKTPSMVDKPEPTSQLPERAVDFYQLAKQLTTTD